MTVRSLIVTPTYNERENLEVLAHDPKYLPSFLDALNRDADLVIGSRNVPGGDVEGWGPVRRFISKGGSLYPRLRWNAGRGRLER